MRMNRALGIVGGVLTVGGLIVLAGFRGWDQPVARAEEEKPSRARNSDRPTNRLAKETSPYLLQHAHNPVDWYPWGPEALGRAKKEGKPIFLSVGYSTCYWCHVMERECFMDEAIARLLNERFVCIKVDREERPDVDRVYMAALQSLGQGGGWPMSMFLTPDGRPFFGGTYFPPRDRDGMEGFPTLLDRVWTAWRDHRAELERDADRLAQGARRALALGEARRRVPLSRRLAAEGRARLADQFDPEYGGFGYDPRVARRPKFPEPSNLLFLLDQRRRDVRSQDSPQDRARGSLVERPGRPEPLAMVLRTLDRMARGGIRDQLAGGYHRYSTERTWTVPHFEKMLYDNAQLASVLVLAFEATGDPRWRAEAEATLAFLERSFLAPEGAFDSAIDAETDGEEGRYYVWTPAQVRGALRDQADYDLFARVYGLDRAPNFEGGRYVLFEPRPRPEQAEALELTPEALEARLAPLRRSLLAERERRPAPRRDDKKLTAWNGLTIAAYAEAFRVFKDSRHRRAAERTADFLWTTLRTPDSHLLRTYRAGQAKLPAYLEDYAFLADGLLRLHAATGDRHRLEQARTLLDRVLADFADRRHGGFFDTAAGHESLLARSKDPVDGALPSGNSVAIRSLIALAAATGEPRYLDAAGQALDAFSPVFAEFPTGAPLMLTALEEYLDARPKPEPKPVAGALAAGASDRSARPDTVTARAELAKPSAPIAPGGEIDVSLILTIRDGWHLSANPSNSSVVKPTTVTLAPDQTHTLVRVEYPTGRTKALAFSASEKLAVYEGQTTMTARIRLSDEARPGPATITFQVRYQACDDRSCLAPATLSVPLKLTVGSR